MAVIESNELLDLFGDVVADKPTIDRAQLAHALAHTIAGMTLEQIVSIITNEYREIIEYVKLAKGARTCGRTSLLFNPHRLDTASADCPRSIYSAMQDPTWHDGFARATIYTHWTGRESLAETFYRTIGISVQSTQYVCDFLPSTARDICTDYRLNADSRVLDPCGGWGGRMLGVSVVANTYTCYEPATRTAAGLTKLAAFIKALNPTFRAEINCQPYEDSAEREQYYDFALTSPPYYDTEIYSAEATNSLNRYETFDAWLAGFYYPLIDKTMRQLKTGCAFIVNVADRRWPLTEKLFEHCASRYAIRRLGPFGMTPSAGFGRLGDAGEKFYEITHALQPPKVLPFATTTAAAEQQTLPPPPREDTL